jgi:periplasmic nitrate reductase NapE
MLDDAPIQKKKELQAFLFLTVVVAPLMAVTVVGGYGLLIWLYQMFAGLPGG